MGKKMGSWWNVNSRLHWKWSGVVNWKLEPCRNVECTLKPTLNSLWRNYFVLKESLLRTLRSQKLYLNNAYIIHEWAEITRIQCTAIWWKNVRQASCRSVSSDWMVLVVRYNTYNVPSKRKNPSSTLIICASTSRNFWHLFNSLNILDFEWMCHTKYSSGGSVI